MTEAEWLACVKPTDMMEHLGWFASAPRNSRKEELHAVGCWRRIAHLITNVGLHGVELYEKLADGLVTEDEVETARQAAISACEQGEENPCCQSLLSLDAAVEAVGAEAAYRTRPADFDPYSDVSREQSEVEHLAGYEARDEEEAAQCALFRCVFGNPFRPVTVNPSWLTSTVVQLAEGIYQDRAFDRMPILADALEVAGCDNENILNHCRQPGEHVRGCWVVDLLTRRK